MGPKKWTHVEYNHRMAVQWFLTAINLALLDAGKILRAESGGPP